mgnify:CR=1 FL=1
MIVTIALNSENYQLNIEQPLSLAIPIAFQSATNIASQPNHFSANFAQSKPMQAGSFIGDTEQGGSCNVNELTINPHCNGTHTETIAHICDQQHNLTKAIDTLLPAPLMPSVVISITPIAMTELDNESYTPALMPDDHLISYASLKNALQNYSDRQLQSLVIRTLPNNMDKCHQAYNALNQPAFFTREAILYLNQRGVEHLIVDLPSLDRLHDDGLLTCHHLFWQVLEGTHQANEQSLVNKTITELAFVDNKINDGFYFLNLQMPAFINDAAPSRPILYRVEKCTG